MASISLLAQMLPLILLIVASLSVAAAAARSPPNALISPPNSTALVHSFHSAGLSNITPLMMQLIIKIPMGISGEFTLFIPADNSIMLDLPRTRELLQYHVAVQRIPYQNLTCLPLGFRIPTLLAGKNIVVTSTRGDTDRQQRLTLDEVEVAMPDLYHDQFLVVHALNGVLNPFMYGATSP